MAYRSFIAFEMSKEDKEGEEEATSSMSWTNSGKKESDKVETKTERDKGTERERNKDRERQRHRKRKKQRQRERYTETQRETLTERYKDTERERNKDREREKGTDIECLCMIEREIVCFERESVCGCIGPIHTQRDCR